MWEAGPAIRTGREVVGPELDGRQAEAVDLDELAEPRPRGVEEAHQIAAVCLVPGEPVPRVLGAADGFVEVVVDPRILVALYQERVKA